MRPILAATMLLLLALPHAAAQAPVVSSTLIVVVQDPGGAGLVPGAEQEIAFSVRYNVQPGGQPAPDANERDKANKTRVVATMGKLPSWAESARFEPAEFWFDVPPQKAAGYQETRMGTLFLRVKEDAPAFAREELTVRAEAAPNGNIAGHRAESQPITLRPGVVGNLNVTSEVSDAIIPGGRWSVVPFTVRNDGNSNVTARLNVTLAPENSQIEFPKTITLDPGQSAVVEVRIRTPWTEREIGTLALEAVPLLDGEDGRSFTHEVEVVGQSAVPGPGVGLLVVALLALARRR